MFIATQVLYWWVFINFISSLPIWLYPLLTFILAGGIFMLLGNLIPGVLIASVNASFWITCLLTSVNALLGSILSLNLETKFDSNVTQKLVNRLGHPVVTQTPGFIYLEIDGLGGLQNFPFSRRTAIPISAGDWGHRSFPHITGLAGGGSIIIF